jgi:hypothetical protein
MMVWEDGAYEECCQKFKEMIEKVFESKKIYGLTVHDVYFDVAGEGLYWADISTPTMERTRILPAGPWADEDQYLLLANGIHNSYLLAQYSMGKL